MFRHGDVLLTRVATPPPTWRPRPGRVVAYGEVTGHTHALTMDGLLYEAPDGTVYIRAQTEVAITHEEHGTLPLPAGIYRVTYQREYNPYADRIRRVID